MRGLPTRCRRCAVGAIVVVGGLLPAWPQVEVGQAESVRIESRDYRGVRRGNPRVVWSEVIHRSGASYLALHFAQFELTAGDVLILTDAAGGQELRLSGRGKANAGTFWARHFKGDTVRLDLHAASRRGGPGFVIDEIAVGDPGATPRATDALCGTDDMRNVVCYQESHPIEYGKARAVARLLIGGTRLCTGWLVSPYNHLLTNAHCINNEAAALNTDFEFGADAPGCTDGSCALCHPGEVFSGGTLVKINTSLDYALVRVDTGDPAARYGSLEIDPAGAAVGDQIYIPQHARGQGKKLAIFSSDATDGGVCRISSVTSPPCFGTGYHDVGYMCDTWGGSSGSPVLSSSTHRVVALHHCANCPNRAVPIGLVNGDIHNLLVGGCTSDAVCDDGQFCTGPDSCVDGNCVRGELPCPGLRCEEDTQSCEPLCNADGVCDLGETCLNCPTDCIQGTAFLATCGNQMCEIGGGENCLTCPADCNSSGGDCCGIDATCFDSLCRRGRSCTRGSGHVVQYCCGDAYCGGYEDPGTCAIDCPGGG